MEPAVQPQRAETASPPVLARSSEGWAALLEEAAAASARSAQHSSSPAPSMLSILQGARTVFVLADRRAERALARLPPSGKPLRGRLWRELSGASRIEALFEEGLFARLLAAEGAHDEAIELDVGRTFPAQEYFRSDAVRGELSKVLRAYAAYDAECGYVQGLGFVAGTLLYHLEDAEQAFFVLIQMMNGLNIRWLYVPPKSALSLALHQLDALIAARFPALHASFRSKGVTAELYGTQWFVTLFSYRGLPIEAVAKIWDFFFLRGPIFLFQVALALVAQLEEQLLAAPFEDVMQILLHKWRGPCTTLIDEALLVEIDEELLASTEARFTQKMDGMNAAVDADASADTWSGMLFKFLEM